jgi:hydroxypyruvate isomerase
MKLCVAIPCFFGKWDFCEALRRAKALGFDAAESYNWKGLDFEKVKSTCEDADIKLLSLCTSDFRATVPEVRSEYLSALRESCEAASKMGVKRLITQSGPNTGAERAVQHENLVATLKEASPILEHYGITLMLEPLNTFVNHPDTYLWSSAEGFDIIKEVDSPNVKLIFDIYHQQIMEGNIIPNVVNNLPYIEHLHSAGSDGRHELWLGESDYNYIFDAIDKAGYDGYCGLEYSPLLPAEESLLKAKEKYEK